MGERFQFDGAIDWKKNEILKGIHEEGREEGRVRHASTAQLTEWLTKGPAATRLDEVVPRR